MPLSTIANRFLTPLGFKIVRKQHETSSKPRDALYYQHHYGGGYNEYRDAQISANKLKFDRVWAEKDTLECIAQYIETSFNAPTRQKQRGLCHGARNGWEVKWLKERLRCDVLGTDISETAIGLEDMVQHDFHDVEEAWIGQFSFIYTNSLDQAFDPARALRVWVDQLAEGGSIFIEHTIHHSPSGASAMDPFGAHPMVMPYFFFEWGRGKYELANILRLNDVKMGDRGVFPTKGDVWVFVLKKTPPEAGAGQPGLRLLPNQIS